MKGKRSRSRQGEHADPDTDLTSAKGPGGKGLRLQCSSEQVLARPVRRRGRESKDCPSEESCEGREQLSLVCQTPSSDGSWPGESGLGVTYSTPENPAAEGCLSPTTPSQQVLRKGEGRAERQQTSTATMCFLPTFSLFCLLEKITFWKERFHS